MDAVTDAYVSEKKISLFVNFIDEGGLIERFAFGHQLEMVHPLPPLIVNKPPETFVPVTGEAGGSSDISESPKEVLLLEVTLKT